MAKLYRYTLTYGATTLEMDNPSSPEGWDKLEMTLRRDKKLYGVFFEFSETDLTFYGEAKDLIVIAYQTDGINALVGLKIDYSPYADENYTTIIEGLLNFTDYELIDNAVSISVEQEDLQTIFKTRSGSEFNLISDTSIGGVDLSGVNAGMEWDLILKSRALLSRTEANAVAGFYENPFNNWINLEQIVTNDIGGDDGFFPDDLRLYIQPRTESEAGDYTARVVVEFQNQALGASGDIGFKKDTGGIISFLNQFSGASGTIDFSYDFTVAIGEQLGVFASPLGGTVEILSMKVTFSKLTTVADRTVKAISLGEAFRNANQRLLDNQAVFKSDLLGFPNGVRDDDGYFPDQDYESNIAPELIKFYKFLVLNGFYVRGFPSTTEKTPVNEDAKPFTARFDKLFESANAILPLGAGFDADGAFRVDRREAFFDSLLTYDLGEVDKLSISPDLDNTISNIKIGYKKFENNEDSQNALLGIHGQSEWNTPIDRYEGKFTEVSEFIGDMYSIELTRRQEYDSQTKRGWKYDKDIFIVHAFRQNLTQWRNFRDEQIIASSNLEDPASVYNLAISTQKNARRHQKWSTGALRPYFDAEVCNFLSGEPNTRPQIHLDSTAPILPESAEIAESADLDIDGVVPVFNGDLYAIEKVVTIDEFIALKATARGLINFSYSGMNYLGYINELRYKPEESLIRLELIGAN